jgi:hypothetical protein
MALTSSSTVDDALAQYNNNLSWEGDVTKAAAALEAIRFLFINRPYIISTENRSINFESLNEEKLRLQEFIGRAGSGINRASFTRGRMLL